MKKSRINKCLSIEETEDSYTFFLGEKAHLTVKKADKMSLKLAIVSIVNGRLARQVELSRILGISRQSISNYMKRYRECGLSALADQRPHSHGIPQKIEKRVIELLSTPKKKKEIADIIFQEFGREISRTKIYEIRKQNHAELEDKAKKKAGESN